MSVAAAAMAIPEVPRDQRGLFGGFRFSIPWASSAELYNHPVEQKMGQSKSYAEGVLRGLLKVAEPLRNQEAKSPSGINELPG
jgi:hypothetical protein